MLDKTASMWYNKYRIKKGQNTYEKLKTKNTFKNNSQIRF